MSVKRREGSAKMSRAVEGLVEVESSDAGHFVELRELRGEGGGQ